MISLWKLPVFTPRSQVIGLFFLALGVRLAFVLTLENRLTWPDEVDFNDIAVGLLHGAGYQSDPFRANPVLPFFLAGVYKLFGYSYIAARVVQSFIGSLTACIVFALANSLFTRRVALLAGLDVAFYPSLVYITGVFYVSCLETFLLALSLYLLAISCDNDSLKVLLLSGVVMGITTLCRPASLMLLPFAACFVLLSFPGRTLHRTAYALSLVFVVCITIVPWTLRNYAVYRHVIPVSIGSGGFLWKGNNELSWGDAEDRSLSLMPGEDEVWTSRLQELALHDRRTVEQKYAKVKNDLKVLDAVGQDRYLQKLALAYMTEHPVRSLELFVSKVGTLYTAFTPVRAENGEVISHKRRFLFSLLFYPTLLLGAFGALYGLREWRKHLLMYLPIAALTLGYGVLTAAARFRVPIEPYIIIFACYGCTILWEFITGPNGTTLAAHSIQSMPTGRKV
jgi:4-amino-4-deoxy-L-arabinose transferase-like glycosyltransferase